MSLPLGLRNAAKPIRIAPYGEAVALIMVLLVLNFIFFSSAPGFFDWPFNPYLFVVLVIGGRYGLLPGLFTAVLCLAAYLGSIYVIKEGVPLYLLLTPPHYGILISFSLGAVIIGNLADLARQRLRTAIEFYDETRLRHNRLSTQFTLLSDEKHLLDKQVLSEEETFPALVSVFDDLDRLDPEEIPPRILRIAPRLLGGGRVAIYSFEGQSERGKRVAADDGQWPDILPRNHPVLDRALEEGGVVTVAHLRGIFDLGSLARDPIQLACKLQLTDATYTLALVMRELPFSGFAPSRLAALESGLGIAARALDRAILFKQTQDRNIDDPITRASTMAYFHKRFEEDYFLARRHKMPLCILTVRVPSLERRIKPEQTQKVRGLLAKAFFDCLRKGDVLAHHPTLAGSYAVLLPFTPIQGATVVADRFRAKVHSLIMKPDAPATDADFVVNVFACEPEKNTQEELTARIEDLLEGRQ